MIRILIADDEASGRGRLAQMVAAEKDCEIVAEAVNGADALDKIREFGPDVVFLDIDMPVKSGLDVAAELTRSMRPPLVVFVTAFSQHAVEAFERNAVDYILKPTEPDRVAKTFERLRGRLSQKEDSKGNLFQLIQDLVDQRSMRKVVAFRRKSRDRIVIDPSEIYYFQIKYSETLVRTLEEELLVRSTFKDLLEYLDSNKFVLIHREFIVNIDRIKKVSPAFHGNYEITMNHPAALKIPLSKRYVKDLNKTLKGL